MDKHKISFNHRQLHPSMIGLIDLLDISKNVGQSGTISPWADISTMSNVDINKYTSIKFELYQFIEEHFPSKTLRFEAKDIVEYNNILDRLVMFAHLACDYRVPEKRLLYAQ